MSYSRERVVAEVNSTLVDEFEIDPAIIAVGMRLREDLQLDSLDAVDMIVALEQKLKMRVDEEQAKAVRTVGDIYDLVERLLNQN